MGLTSPFWNGNRKKRKKNCIPAIWDGNRNYQKAFPLFGTGTRITKKLSHYLGREQESQKNSSGCSGTQIQGINVGKYTGMELQVRCRHTQNSN